MEALLAIRDRLNKLVYEDLVDELDRLILEQMARYQNIAEKGWLDPVSEEAELFEIMLKDSFVEDLDKMSPFEKMNTEGWFFSIFCELVEDRVYKLYVEHKAEFPDLIKEA